MAQYDAILRFASAAAAKADPVMQQHWDAAEDLFAGDRAVICRAWRTSMDTTDGSGNIVHSYMTGFFVLISLDRVVPAIRDHAALQLAFDRNKMNARQSGFVLRSTVTAPVLADIRFEPVFAGMDVPWGGLN